MVGEAGHPYLAMTMTLIVDMTLILTILLTMT